MELNEIASMAGKGGLYRIVKPTRNGVILESLDKNKKRLVATASQRVSSLHEISIYTTDLEGSAPLEDVLKKIYEDFDDDPGLDSSSSPEELKGFLQHILPTYDKEKVYVSDIKRLVSWYKIIYKEAPEILKGEEKPKAKKAAKSKEAGTEEPVDSEKENPKKGD